MAEGHEKSFGGDRNVLHPDCSGCFLSVYTATKAHQFEHFKWIHLIVYKLNLNKIAYKSCTWQKMPDTV